MVSDRRKGCIGGNHRLAEQVAERFGHEQEEVLGAFMIAPEYRQIGIFEISRQAALPRDFVAAPLLREALRVRAESLVLFYSRSRSRAPWFCGALRLVEFALGALAPLKLELRDLLIVEGKAQFYSVRRFQPW